MEREGKEIAGVLETGFPESLQDYFVIIGLQDRTLAAHVRNVAAFSIEIARRAGLSLHHRRNIWLAALLHDVGKLMVPKGILEKNGALTREEWELLQTHSQAGSQVLASVKWSAPLAPIVRGHHERWDGAGYPDRLRGEDIPVGARILAVADTLDAMTTDRPYRKALSIPTALAEIQALRGTQFDPKVVDIALTILPDDWAGMRHTTALAALESSLRGEQSLPVKPARRAPRAALTAAAS